MFDVSYIIMSDTLAIIRQYNRTTEAEFVSTIYAIKLKTKKFKTYVLEAN